MKARKLTVVELISLFVLLTIFGVIFLSQKNTLDAIQRDRLRKTAINEIYYNLEEVVYPKLKGYPAKLDAKQLSAMNDEYLRDPGGRLVNDRTSDYVYEPTGCNGGALCSGFTLRASLEREADFVKSSLN